MQQQLHQHEADDIPTPSNLSSLPTGIRHIWNQRRNKDTKCSDGELTGNVILFSLMISEKLAEFLDCSISYRVRKLKQYEIISMVHYQHLLLTVTSVCRDRIGASSTRTKRIESHAGIRRFVLFSCLITDASTTVSMESQTEAFATKKRGVKITSYLQYGSVLDPEERSDIATFTNHMKKHYFCPTCRQKFIFTLDEVKQHNTTCKAAVDQQEEPLG